MLLIVALAVLGGIVFSQVDISPAITFILGVLASAFVVNFSSTDSKSVGESVFLETQLSCLGKVAEHQGSGDVLLNGTIGIAEKMEWVIGLGTLGSGKVG